MKEGCDCLDDSFCGRGEKCKNCACLPQDCDCDERAANPDEFCSRGERCKLCRCLAGDCDCDETAANPDSFCLSGEKCKVARSYMENGDTPQWYQRILASQEQRMQ